MYAVTHKLKTYMKTDTIKRNSQLEKIFYVNFIKLNKTRVFLFHFYKYYPSFPVFL